MSIKNTSVSLAFAHRHLFPGTKRYILLYTADILRAVCTHDHPATAILLQVSFYSKKNSQVAVQDATVYRVLC